MLTTSETPVGRFAPSPTGRMHAGNIFASLVNWLLVKAQGGSMVLRIEDLDRERSRREHIDHVMHDFETLGLTWDKGPYYQHDRDEAYRSAFSKLRSLGLVYPCYCTRADLLASSAPHHGEKTVYAGTCRSLGVEERAARDERIALLGDPCRKHAAQRLMVDDRTIELVDIFQGPYAQKLDSDCGDFLVQRADDAFAYQLAVVVDDAEQGVNTVVRGVDLLCSTPQQIYLQDLLGLARCEYGHVPLMVDETGRRLAKRNRDAAFDELLVRYKTPAGVIGHIAYLGGLRDEDAPVMPEELLADFSIERLQLRYRGVIALPFS